MKRFVVVTLCNVLILIGWGSIPANAQGTAAAHVAAAKAIADSVPKNREERIGLFLHPRNGVQRAKTFNASSGRNGSKPAGKHDATTACGVVRRADEGVR